MNYEYNCLMLPVTIKNWENWYKLIPTEWLYKPNDGYGLENNPHITICYGIHQHITPELLEEYLPSVSVLDDIQISGLSVFRTSPDFDVLKMDIQSEKIHQLNGLVKKYFPVTPSYPDYQPHITIAYLNKNWTGYSKLAVNPSKITAVPHLSSKM